MPERQRHTTKLKSKFITISRLRYHDVHDEFFTCFGSEFKKIDFFRKISISKVQNNFTSTAAGPICKVIGFGSNKLPEWETYIGSPVVNFSVCAKYVLICSKDCTVRFLDIRKGTPVLPILHMPSPVIQSVFVSSKRSIWF